MNHLEFGSKQRTLFSIAILHSERFRQSRSMTRKGKMLYNKELRIAKRKVRQHKIHLNKELPERMEV